MSPDRSRIHPRDAYVDAKGSKFYVNGKHVGYGDFQVANEWHMDSVDFYKNVFSDTTTSTTMPITTAATQTITLNMWSNDLMSQQDFRNQVQNYNPHYYHKHIPASALDPNKQLVTPPAGFNKYVNASDLLEEFIGFLGDEKVRQSEVMGLPIELFIKWLVVRACEEDGEEPNTVLELPAPTPQPRCLGCQRFMHKGTKLPLHSRHCATHLFSRTEGAQVVQEKGTRSSRAKRPALL